MAQPFSLYMKIIIIYSRYDTLNLTYYCNNLILKIRSHNFRPNHAAVKTLILSESLFYNVCILSSISCLTM
jgi:hypothetical protein